MQNDNPAVINKFMEGINGNPITEWALKLPFPNGRMLIRPYPIMGQKKPERNIPSGKYKIQIVSISSTISQTHRHRRSVERS